MLCLLSASAVSAQAPPPNGDWLTFSTEHFRVTYQPELEPLARQAAAVAERTHGVLSRELTEAPEGTIDLVVTDHADYSNGFARPFPSNRIVVFGRPAATGEFFARDWVELVVAHELVHTFHMDRSGLVGDAVRTLFGRIPLFWPVFSVTATPAWSTEGLATHYETRLTGAGRIQAALHDMIIRTAALEGAFPDLDELSAPSPVWPAGNRSYVYGARFMRYIADTYGPEAHEAIVDATAGSVWPTFLRFDHVAARAVGMPFDRLYDTWRAAAMDSAEAVRRRVLIDGLTETRPVAGRGPYAVAPRVSPDGGRLTFAASDWRSDPATRLVELGAGETRELARRNQFGMILDPASWLPDGSAVVVAQLEFDGPYRLFSDLWRVDLQGRETRLTEGHRLAQPDVGPDGRRVAAVQTDRAGIRLVVHDMETGENRVVGEAAPGQSFDRPRWSPDGRRIAAGRHVDGRTDMVVVDVPSGAIIRVTDDTALDMAPAWSPDGRWLLWWSDRTGIPNIMALAFEDGRPVGPVRQVTNVLTGVIDPEVGPDGETLFLAAYHPDGWRIEAMPFDPALWPEAPPPSDRYTDALLPPPPGYSTAVAAGEDSGGIPDSAGVGTVAGAQDVGGVASPYSPWPTLRPYYWLPSWEAVGSAGDGSRLGFIGASVGGTDVIRRHTWSLALAGDIHTGRAQGNGFWIYRGLGSPDLFVSAEREWDIAGRVTTSGGPEPILLRDDELVAGAWFQRRSWRSAGQIEVRAELERQAFEGRSLSRAELEADSIFLRRPPTLAGLAVGPAFGTARAHPFSISPEDGVSIGLGVGRWWATGSGAPAYDELTGRAAGYLALPLWGFANHVLAVRGAGLVRDGDLAPVRSIGGPGIADLLVTTTEGSSFPVRGFSSGDRFGTRAWSANVEWRFPIHMRNAPGRLFGFSLTSLSGALFVDAGNAWCTGADLARPGFTTCHTAGAEALVSTGAELKIDLGILHNSPARLALGVAQPIQGPADRPVFYLGTAF